MRHRKRGTGSRPPGQDQSGPEAMLDALLDGAALPGDDQAGLQPVAEVLAALRAPGTPAELTGQASALAAFRAQPHRSTRATRSARAERVRRDGWPGPRLRPRPAMALAAGVVLVAGLAAGAFVPGPVEQLVHHTFGLTASRSKTRPQHHATPTPTRSPSPTPSPSPSPSHKHSLARSSQAPHGPQHSHRPGRQDGHQHDGQQSPGPESPGGQGGRGGSPSPSAHSSPNPSTSPAAQPSPQPSTSPHQHSSTSSPP